MIAPKPAYTYRATVVRWVDGDTMYATVDLGFRMSAFEDFRLYGIDAPEHNAPGGSEATEWMRGKAPVGTVLTARVYKDPEKYGRWLVELYLDGQDVSLNQQCVAAGHARAYFGGRKP